MDEYQSTHVLSQRPDWGLVGFTDPALAQDVAEERAARLRADADRQIAAFVGCTREEWEAEETGMDYADLIKLRAAVVKLADADADEVSHIVVMPPPAEVVEFPLD